MKTSLLVVLLALSLAANAALYLQSNPPAGSVNSSPPAAEKSAAKRGTGVTASPAGSDAAASAAKETAQLAQVRELLQTGDLKTLVVRLRAAGVSPAMIRSIIAAQIYEQFAARRKALLAQQGETPFWKTQQRSFMDPKTMAAMRDLGREQTNMIKELLGPDGVPGNEEMQAYQRRQFGDLPSGKVELLQSIAQDYNDLRSQIYSAANGLMLPEDREKLALLEKEQRVDLAAVLTPQELENYDLRSSATANTLRSQLSLFNPTEEEFRALFKLQQAFDEKYGSSSSVTNAEQFRQRQTQQQELLAQAQALLSAERYAEYKQSIDPAYQMVNRLVARLELPASAATQVVTMQQEFQKRAAQLRADQTLTPEQRNLQYTALSQEATTRLTTVLGGTRGFEAYKQYGGQWVQNMVPRTTSSPPRG